MHTNMPKKRVEHIDIMKGIGIILVVLGHRRIPHNLYRFIYAFHMPLFFFISGYLFNKDSGIKFVDFFKKKFKSLMIPYFYFSIISIIIQLCFIKINIFASINLKEILKGLFVLEGRPVWNVPLWFLICLFFVEMIYFGINQISNKIPIWISTLFFTIVGYFCVKNNVFTFFKISIAFTVIIFFYAGNLLKSIEPKIKIHINKIMIYISFIILTGLTYYLSVYKNGHIDIDLLAYSSYKMFILNAFIGITSTHLISKQLVKVSLLKFLGRNSLIIMSTHYIVFQILQIIYKNISKVPVDFSLISIKIAIIYTILTIIISVPLIILINRYIPILVGKSKIKNLS